MSLSRIRLVKRPIGVVAKAPVFQSRFYSVGGNKPIHDSPPLTSRWFADLQGQLKELTDSKQSSECARQARELYEFSQTNWLELLAGQQGFLTDKKWRGLDNHQLLWGDMPLKFPDHITLVYKLLEEPTYESTSLKMEAWILSEQYRRVAARCIDDTVIYDYTTAKKSVLKPFMVDKLKHTFKSQQESQRKYTDEANRVIKAVEELKMQYT
ncbi:thioesterase-like superfamily-domain-containing protein [Fusarium acuminatum]|uniref:Thioesterase-like superfamily-domain-containing protein n=1 Tax=Fusarium acuminatum TaxID=5515 RepID=A0ABZ2WQN6_9HYPO